MPDKLEHGLSDCLSALPFWQMEISSNPSPKTMVVGLLVQLELALVTR